MRGKINKPKEILLIPLFMLLGTTIFLFIVMYQVSNLEVEAISNNGREGTESLLFAFLMMYIVCVSLTFMIPKFVKLMEGEKDFQLIGRRYIVKFGLLTGVTFFGLVVILHSIESKILSHSDLPYVGLLGYATLLTMYIRDFPALKKYSRLNE